MVNELEQKITDYIVSKYSPVAIVIHGSRAIGKAREHSDWDYIIFTKEVADSAYEIIFGANLQIKAVKLPVSDEKLSDYKSYLRKGNVKVVFDPEHITEEFITKATELYTKSVEYLPIHNNEARVLFLSYIDSLIDYQHEQEAFFRKLAELYVRVIKYWFHILHHTYMPQVYDALPRIEKEDPEYFQLIKVLASNVPNQEKIAVAEEVYKRIWK